MTSTYELGQSDREIGEQQDRWLDTRQIITRFDPNYRWPRQYAVTDVLRNEGLSLLVAQESAGKTALVRSIAFSIAAGLEDFAGKTIRLPQRDVILYDPEETEADLNGALTAWTMQFEEGEWQPLLEAVSQALHVPVATQRYVGDPGLLKQIEGLCDRHPEARVVILDGWQFLSGIEENDNTAIQVALSDIKTLANRRGLSILICVHTNSASRKGQEPPQPRGASAFRDVADSISYVIPDFERGEASLVAGTKWRGISRPKEDLRFAFESVVVGTDDDEQAVTKAAIVNFAWGERGVERSSVGQIAGALLEHGEMKTADLVLASGLSKAEISRTKKNHGNRLVELGIGIDRRGQTDYWSLESGL